MWFEKKKLGKKWISLHLNEFNLKDGFENYIVAKILMRLKMIKRYGRKKKKNTHTHTHNSTFYINSFCCTIPKLTKIKNL